MLIPVSTLFKVPMWSAGCIEIHTENPETLVWFARSPRWSLKRLKLFWFSRSLQDFHGAIS